MSRLRQLIVFLGIFSLILGLSHFYILERISYYLQFTQGQHSVAAAVLTGLALLTIAALPLSRVLPRPLALCLGWIVYPWMGVALLLVSTLVLTDIVWLLFYVLSPSMPFDRSVTLQSCFGAVSLSVVAALAGYSLWNGLRVAVVKPVDITLKRLPSSLDGLRIVQLSDLHVGPLISGKWLMKVVAKVNALKPDIIAITGDLVDGSVKELRKHVEPLKQLKAKHGVYFITGNHEYYSGAAEWCAHLEELGVRVLQNEHVAINAGGADDIFHLAGVNDWTSRHFPGGGSDLKRALVNRDVSKPVILLAHQPAAIHEAAAHGVDLQLSGHTHGGQIWPFNYLVKLNQPYTKGLHRYGDTETQVYISAGTGFWGPPMRLGTTAEISHITLRAL